MPKTGLFVVLIVISMLACGKKEAPGGPGFSVQVVVEAAQKQAIDEVIPLVGTLAANESVEIKAETEGQVEKINFVEGQFVEKGHILFLIEGAKLAAQVGQADATFKLSEANLKRSEALFKNNTISRQEYDQAVSRFEAEKAALEFMRQELNEATVEAPFSGRIGARLVSPGQVVSGGTILTTLIDSNPMKVEFSVPERYSGKLSTKLDVHLSVAPFPGETFKGRVYFVSPEIDPTTRTVLVKAMIPNNNGKLRPGLFANLDLRLGTIPDGVLVSESALIKQADSVQLYVVGADNTAELRQVVTGVRFEGKVQILSGVLAGEQVIIEGNQKIGPGVPVSFNVSTSTENPKS